MKSINVFIIIVLACCTGYAQQDSLADLFPLQVGNYWRYNVADTSTDLEGGMYRETKGTLTVQVESLDRTGDTLLWHCTETDTLLRYIHYSYSNRNDTTFHEASTLLFTIVESPGGRHRIAFIGV